MMSLTKGKKMMFIGILVLAFGIVLLMGLLPFSVEYSFNIYGNDVSAAWLITSVGALIAVFGFLLKDRWY